MSRFYAEMLEERRTQAEKDQEVYVRTTIYFISLLQFTWVEHLDNLHKIVTSYTSIQLVEDKNQELPRNCPNTVSNRNRTFLDYNRFVEVHPYTTMSNFYEACSRLSVELT